MLPVYVCTIEFEIRIFGKKVSKPVLQLLFTFLFKLKTHLSTNNLMSTIIHAPNHIGIITIVQSSTICESTNVFTNHCRLAIVMLKLNPANFLGKFAEFFYQYGDISYHICIPVLISIR